MKQQQQQVITQRITTAATTVILAQVLQCSTEELYEYIDNLAQENPVIDTESIAKQEQSFLSVKKMDWLRQQNYFQRKSQDDDSYDSEYINELWDLDANESISLAQSLLLQINTMKLDSRKLEIANCIVNSLDENGFFAEPIESFAKRLQIDTLEVVDVMEILQQQLEPAGVCAFDFRNSLCLQVDRVNGDPLARKIIMKHLDSVARNKPGTIARLLKEPKKRVAACCELIKSLDPYCCRAFSQGSSTHYIYQADITVSIRDGLVLAELSGAANPQIILSSYYLELRATSGDKEVNSYLDLKIQQAQWVQRCISKRQTLMLSLAGIIIKRQADFFLFGIGRLHPLALTDAARELGVHESTISRAVRNKYLQCSHGLFPMSYFFPSGVRVSGDNIVSNDQIKAQIRNLVDTEDKSAPLNDRIMADILDDLGMSISRRTVAKYRDAMKIDPACKRRCKAKAANP